jgi:hypothetical protein
VKGRLELSTGDGGVEVAGALSRVKAHTGDGSITVRAASGSTAEEDWELTSGDGGMTVELPPSFAAQVDAHTGDGGITVDGLTIAGAQLSPQSFQLQRHTFQQNLRTFGNYLNSLYKSC